MSPFSFLLIGADYRQAIIFQNMSFKRRVLMEMESALTMFIGECENSSLKAFNSCKKKTVKFINHLMGCITRESVRVSVHCTMYIYIYCTPSETVFTTYMQFVHLKIYWKVHNIIIYNDRLYSYFNLESLNHKYNHKPDA